jgi:hypothetical protein
MRIVALVDLDDTLFQTMRKCPADVPVADLTPIGFTREGAPLSYATPRQMGFVNWLIETTHFVPVTARSLDALRRVRLPFTQGICAHGGIILDHQGVADRDWATHIAFQAALHAPTLADVADAIAVQAEAMGADVSVRVLDDDGVGLYVLVKHGSADEAVLNAVVDAVKSQVPPMWTDHRNSNNIALMPPFLGKQFAVAHLMPSLRAQHPDATFIGIGDSLTDAPFMALCDFAMTPSASQLGRRLL